MTVQQKSVARSNSFHRNGDRSRGVLPNVTRLLSARKSRGLTQEQLAALAEVDVKTVRKGESNMRLDVASLARIATAVGLELSDALAESSVAVRKSRISVVRRWQLAWLRRDIHQLLLGYHDEAVVVLPGEPLIPFSGSHQGHVEIARLCESTWRILTSVTCRECEQQVLDSQTAVALRCSGQISTNCNQSFQLSCIHIFQFEERLIIKHHIEYDTLSLSRLMLAS